MQNMRRDELRTSTSPTRFPGQIRSQFFAESKYQDAPIVRETVRPIERKIEWRETEDLQLSLPLSLRERTKCRSGNSVTERDATCASLPANFTRTLVQ